MTKFSIFHLQDIVLSFEDVLVDYVPPLVTAGLPVVSFFVVSNAAFVDVVRHGAAPELMLQLGVFFERR